MTRIARFVSCLGLFLACAFALEAVSFGQTSNTWSPAGPLAHSRTGAAAVQLIDGTVLITGGLDASNVPQASTEIFNPVTGAFTEAAPMNTPRANHAAIVLNSGDVLVAGGATDAGGDLTASAEIYNGASGQWTALTAALPQALSGEAMAKLADGTVLIAGGSSTAGPVNTALLFNPADNSITPQASVLNVGRVNAVAAATPDGHVLIAGGTDINGAVLASAELFTYDPTTMTGTISGSLLTMSSPRTLATATSTYDGVAIIGGNDGQKDLDTADIYSQWTGAFRAPVSGATARSGAIALRLPNNGAIVVMGGSGGTAVDLLQPWANSLAGAFAPSTAPSVNNHDGGFAAPAGVGSMLAAGGKGDAAITAEIYHFPTVSTDQPDYAPGTPVVMAGSGFAAGETVNLYMREWVNQLLVDPPDYTVAADASGNFSFTGYAPTTADLGARYHLTAVGQSSGYQAQTIFTDASAASSGDGQMTVTPTSATAGSTGDNFTFTFQGESNAGHTFNAGSIVTVTIPAGWSAPQSTNSHTAGYITVSAGTCSASLGSISGSVITINQTCAGTSTFTMSYSDAKAPSTTGPYTFTTASRNGTSGSAVNIATQPVVTVTSANQLASVGVGTQNGVLAYGTSGSATYTVTVTPIAGNSAFTANLSVGTLPTGVTSGGFSPSSLTFGASAGAQTATLTLNYNGGGTAVTAVSFAVTATNNALSTDTQSGNGSITIGRLTPILSVTNSPVTYNGSPQSAAVTGSVGGTASNIRYNGSSTVPTSAGTYAITADFTPTDTTDYSTLTGVAAGNFVINKATPTATLAVNNSPQAYTGSAQAATVAISTSSVSGAVSNILTGGAATQTTAGTYAVTADFVPTDTTDYNTLTGLSAGNFVINKATPTATLAVNNTPQTYSGSGLAATVAISTSSVSGAVSNILTGGAATQTHAGTYAVTADFVPTDTTNYNTLTALPAGNFVIDKATPTATLAVNNSPQTYNGSGQAATVAISASSVSGAVANILTGGAATQTHPGTYAVTADFVPTDTTDYNTLTGLSAGNFVINKATPTATLAVNNSPQTYNGSGQAATVAISTSSVSGAVSNILTGGAATQTNAGTYAVTADFVPADTTDYNTLTGLSAGNFVINKATPTATLAVNNSPQTYNGSGQAATVAISASSVSGAVSNILTGGAATQINAGTYAVTADFVPSDTTNYNTLTALPAGNFVIDKATPTATLAVNNSPQTYSGSGLAATVAISANSVSGAVANILTGGAATQIHPGTYAVTADFVPTDTTNYNTLTALPAGNFVIDKATPTATLAVNNSPQTYSGSGLAATVAISASSVSGAVANILTGGAATQTTAGTYAVTADFVPTDTTDYNTLTGLSAGNFVINKATPTATLAVNNSPQTYNGSGQAATVAISTSSVSGAVANILTGGAATQTHAGTYAVTADFVPTDTTNYNTLTAVAAGNFVINKATPTATLAVNNSPQTYSGSGLAATVAISGSSVSGAVANILTGGAATQMTAGTYAVTADFVPSDTTDYNTLTGLSAGNFVINKAPGSVSISNIPSGPVIGGTFAPTFTALGDGTPSAVSLTPNTCTVNGAGVVSFIGAGTCTLQASITAGTNYLAASGTAQPTTVDYGFAGLFSPYEPPSSGRAYKSGSAIPLSWQYTNLSGVAVPSANAVPAVQIYAASCAGVPDNTDVITINAAGASGYQYDSLTNTWQFNWKTTGVHSGCYVIQIHSGLTNQTSVVFPIQIK